MKRLRTSGSGRHSVVTKAVPKPTSRQILSDVMEVLGMQTCRLLTLSPKAPPVFPDGLDLAMYASSICVVVPDGMAKVLGGSASAPGLSATLADASKIHVPCEGCVYPAQAILPWEGMTAVIAAAQVDMKMFFDTVHVPPTSTRPNAKTKTKTVPTEISACVERLAASPSVEWEENLGPASQEWRLAFGRVLIGVALSRFKSQNPVFNTGRSSIVTSFIGNNLMVANAAAAAAEAEAAAARGRLDLIIHALGAVRKNMVQHNSLLFGLWKFAELEDEVEAGHATQSGLDIQLVNEDDASHTRPLTPADLASSTLYDDVLKGLTMEGIKVRQASIAVTAASLKKVYEMIDTACSIPLPESETTVDDTLPEECRDLDMGGFSPQEVYNEIQANLGVVLHHINSAQNNTTAYRTALGNLSGLLRTKAEMEKMAREDVAFLELFASPGSNTAAGAAAIVAAAATLHPTSVVASGSGGGSGLKFTGGSELPDAVFASLEALDSATTSMAKTMEKMKKMYKRRRREYSNKIRQDVDKYSAGTAWSSTTMIAMQVLGSVCPATVALTTIVGKIVAHGPEVAAAAEAHFASIGLKMSIPVADAGAGEDAGAGAGAGTDARTSHISRNNILIRVHITKPESGGPPVYTEVTMKFPFPNLAVEKNKKKKKKKPKPKSTLKKKRGRGSVEELVVDADADADADPLMARGDDVATFVSVKCPMQVCNKETMGVACWTLSRLLHKCGFWTPGPESTRAARLLTPPPVHPYIITSTTVTVKLPQSIDRAAVWEALESGYGGQTLGEEELFSGVVAAERKDPFRGASFFEKRVSNFQSGKGCNVYVQTPTGTYRVFVYLFTNSLNSMGRSGSLINAAAMFILCAWIAQVAPLAPELNLTTEAFNPDLWRTAGFSIDPITMNAQSAKIGMVDPAVAAVAPYMGAPLRTGKGPSAVPEGITPLTIAEPISANDIFRCVASNFKAK